VLRFEEQSAEVERLRKESSDNNSLAGTALENLAVARALIVGLETESALVEVDITGAHARMKPQQAVKLLQSEVHRLRDLLDYYADGRDWRNHPCKETRRTVGATDRG
jgi:hypothetical protein